MHHMKTAAMAAALSLLTACGGGESQDPQTDQEKYDYAVNSPGPWRCGDLVWLEWAQEWYNRHPGARPDLPPEYTLDPDGDGKVNCPNLPSKGTT
ncbi:hypothetical protein [Rhizobacter sp. Root1221]|uniref:hypothetical protein n=1 Tax=Rhizobacter sp. Root1221 TaxID=1736433 RepID=UPI0006FAE719|nr:hypothetical protein [Rhizobacter sp. Root1221]KQV99947.1 hypothetical protein ASC87_19800 [Rhizobacter sp. Root1221]